MALVKRDAFARTELHKSAYCDSSNSVSQCKECGQTGRLYNFWTKTDGGRTFKHPHMFCSVSCFRAYNS